jgi:glycosyltransferase involved in cell wall biosynthesis
MRILHVTPHLPPDQAANALLPAQLGAWAAAAGHVVEFVAHPPQQVRGQSPLPGPVAWVPRRRRGILDPLRLGPLRAAWRMRGTLAPAIARADLVHVHSNGLLAEVAILLACRQKRPTVLTLYGTEIWHYAERRPIVDLFTRAYKEASAVTFYSDRLRARAAELGLIRRDVETIYPPVGLQFRRHDAADQLGARAALGIRNRHLLLNVKRLHPLAGQRVLLEAMHEIVRVHPDTRLVICGTGALLDELRSVARAAGVERHVTFAGLVDNQTVATYCAAADLFVLPSILEALPTVAVEALASGTPVISTDNPGGLELNDLFGPDVAIVPRNQPLALAQAVVRALQEKGRTGIRSQETLEREFRPAAVWARYRHLYERLTESRPA